MTITNHASLAGGIGAGLTANSNGTILYGTTRNGGSNSEGTIFSLAVNGTTPTTLLTFNGTNGSAPGAEMLLVGNNLYGTTAFGGAYGKGSVFSLSLDTNTLNWSYSFDGAYDQPYPSGGLTLYGNNLYGVTSTGGAYGWGFLYSLSLDGTTMTILYSFTSGEDGAYPSGNLLLDGNTLYGTTSFGGTHNAGTVFAFDLSVVPEPSTWMMLLGGLGFLALHPTRRQDGV